MLKMMCFGLFSKTATAIFLIVCVVAEDKGVHHLSQMGIFRKFILRRFNQGIKNRFTVFGFLTKRIYHLGIADYIESNKANYLKLFKLFTPTN